MNNKMIVKFYTPIINYVDLQVRGMKNKPNIRWVGKVHETLKGYGYLAELPQETEYSIIHSKQINKQRQQNEFYMQL